VTGNLLLWIQNNLGKNVEIITQIDYYKSQYDRSLGSIFFIKINWLLVTRNWLLPADKNFMLFISCSNIPNDAEV
jgi:hypothetical protein